MRSTKGRILCTEDDVDTRELIDFVLTQYGYEVVCSGSNVQAIDLAKTQNFDLYLVDNWMPGLSGPFKVTSTWTNGRYVYQFTNVQVNPTIPATRFGRPVPPAWPAAR
jgi:CheY-like chemotaxis protein